MRLAVVLLTLTPLATIAGERTVRFTAPMYFLPPTKAIVRERTPAHRVQASRSTRRLLPSQRSRTTPSFPSEGPFDIWFVPKDGKPIKAVAGYKAKDGVNDVKLNDYLGVISFRGDGQPRGTLLVTAFDDPGPEGKGHVVVQTASDTRAEMAVVPGDYAVWVVPASGARARRVVDKIRVHAGKTATVD